MSATQTLIDVYEAASPSVRRRGRSWYPTAYRVLSRMAAEHERSVAQAAAVLAITSANTTLGSNLLFTEQILRGERTAGCYPRFQTPLVTGALQTRYPGRFVRGPKCRAFYAAIMGDADALVLDRWAARAAGLDRPGRNDIYPGVRRLLDVAYREGAKLCGETVRAFQAITWIVVRESTPNRRGVIPQFLDITKGVA
jgi:hypothetical protein